MDTGFIVGFVNPGRSFAGNRHNVGALVVDAVAARAGATLRSHKARAVASEIRIGTLPGGAPGPRAVIARPLSYMNESGGPVAGLLSFFKIPVERLVVVHDELDIPFADVRLKRGGGEGGHNGLKSITKSVGTRDYLCVRVGIGRPPGRMDAAAFVLKDFSGTERSELPFLLGDSVDAVEKLVTEGLEATQQVFHSR
ncbi:MAG: aminoacyl-tRNA hydrolase [Oryzihumus sp.]